MGILDALILSFLAFVLGNRQTDFYLDDLQTDNKGKFNFNKTPCLKSKYAYLHIYKISWNKTENIYLHLV